MEDQKIDLIQIVFGTASIILLFACFIIFALYYYQERRFAFQSEMDEMKITFEKNLLTVRLEIQEQTFQQISREIHDNISLSLTLSKLHLSTLNNPKHVFIHPKIDASICLIGDAIQKLRSISKSLNSDLIKENGLISAVENEIATINHTNLFHIGFQIMGTPVYLNSEKELLIFRIIQESLNNAIKHAKTSMINLLFKYGAKYFEVQIIDHGVGMKINEKSSGSGLLNIRQRASLLRGTCEFISQQNKGTTVKIKIPLI